MPIRAIAIIISIIALIVITSDSQTYAQSPSPCESQRAIPQATADWNTYTLQCPEWHITMDSGGYSDKWYLDVVPNWHCVSSSHEVLSGEWAAAIYYDGVLNSGQDPSAPSGSAVWLTPNFLLPSWPTNSSFAEISGSAWDDPNNPSASSPWNDTAQITITNLQVSIQIDLEIADLGQVFASPMGVSADPIAGEYVRSGRYVLLQTYTITNISGSDLDNMEFYQMLHAHPADEYASAIRTVYDSGNYPDPLLSSYVPFNSAHTIGNFRYDTTQWNDPSDPEASRSWKDWIGFSSVVQPDAFDNNYYRLHLSKPFPPGTHWDIEARNMNGVSDSEGEVAGAQMWNIGTLANNASTSITVVLMAGQVDCNENGIPDLCDIDQETSDDININGIPDECEDCNQNAIPDQCELDCGDPGGKCDLPGCGVSTDINLNGLLDDCEDCNLNGLPDECDLDCAAANNNCDVPDCGLSIDLNVDGIPDDCQDCNSNELPDECDLDCQAAGGNCDLADCGLSLDCQPNGIPDDCDIAEGTSQDINTNDIPDECEDCNLNGLPDECDLDCLAAGGNCNVPSCGLSIDNNSNGLLDDCEDCNGNGLPDECDFDCMASGGGCNLPGCGLGQDCNTNAVLDECDLLQGISRDCNSNSIPDECDIANGTSYDCNSNAIPDQCEGLCTYIVLPDGSGDQPTIQAAVDAASPGDVICLCDGTFTGNGNRDIDFAGKAITVRSINDNPDNCVIDCQGTEVDPHRGFRFHTDEERDSVVQGLSIRNGYGPPEDFPYCSYGPSPCSVGGAIYCDRCDPTIINCTISGNQSYDHGAGFFSFLSNAKIINCTFAGNTATYPDIRADAIYCSNSSTKIIGCVISGNNGDAIIHAASNLTISNCIICGNTERGIKNLGGRADGTLIANSTIVGNGAGGLIFSSGLILPMTVKNCTIAGNMNIYPGSQGGGIICFKSIPTVTNTIIWNNVAEFGAQIALVDSDQPATLSLDYCDVEGGAEAAYVEEGCSLQWDDGNINEEPSFPPPRTGIWTLDGNYQSDLHRVVLTDSTATWTPGEFAGKFVNPDTTQVLSFVIHDNTDTTITIWADINTIQNNTSWVTSTADYAIYDYRLQSDSPCIDAGYNDAAILFIDTTTDAGTANTITVAQSNVYTVNDEIEYNNDKILRTVTSIDPATHTITFDDPLPAPSEAGISIHNYGTGDVDNEDRIYGCRIDMGSDESPFFKDCNANATPDACEPDGDNDSVPDDCDNCPNTIPDIYVDSTGCPIIIPCDYDRDGDIDPSDFDTFQACVAGPAMAYPPGCVEEDFDFDGDVDQKDFGIFQRCFSGENIPADPSCAN